LRFALTLVHRWVGLSIALFLFISGVTGAVISWDHELDELLNPHLTEAGASGSTLPSLQLARAFELRDPRARVTYVPMSPEPGHALRIYVEGRVDPETGRARELGYNEVFIDPVSGEENGRREWGQVWPITSETLVSFLYKLHYTLHIPEMWGIDDWGLWFMGAVALLWTLDCFVGFYLTLPQRHRINARQPEPVRRQLRKGWWSRWKPAWLIKASGSAYRINFDIHRASGLWTWGLLFIIAFTGFSLNLYREIFMPVMSLVSQVTPTPFETRARSRTPIEPQVSFEQILPIAQAEGVRRGWTTPIGALRYRSDFGMYDIRFFAPGEDHGAAGVGPQILYFDGQSGTLIGDWQPWTGTAADIFVQAQFPLHSGRILGLPGRIIVSIMGVVVAALSVTGVIIWLRKRRARVARRSSESLGHRSPAPAE
jgi:uncharacterized iron-regulated membrane protein